MKSVLLALAVLIAASACSAQVSLYPRHVVTPHYAQVAKTAHVQGEIVLLVTIAADGTVIDAKRVSGPPLFERTAIENVRSWTFDRPAAAPFTQTLIYDFEFLSEADCKAPGNHADSVVTYDFPTRVSISTCPFVEIDAAGHLGHSKK